MIRPITLLTMILAALTGAYLFAVKHRAQVLDDQLAQTAQQSRLDEQRIRVLQAQWALEIDPTRLAGLATQFTTLQPMKPAQLVTLAALREALPPPGSPAPSNNLIEPNPALLDSGGTNAPVAQASPNALPLPPPAPPEMVVDAAPFETPRHTTAKHLAASAMSHSVLASKPQVKELPPPAPFYTQSQSTLSIMAHVVAVKAIAEVPQINAESGSMLGMAANLPPPQPMSAGGDSN